MVDERSIFQGLVQRGLPPHVAQGFVMNMRDESGLNPAINEVSPTVPGARGGFGLYQVTGPRRTAYEAFASDRGVDPADVDAQLDFLVSELKGPEQRAAQSIFATQDVPSAAAAIARDFLRPAPENLQRRVAQYTGGSTMQPQDLGSMSTQGAMPEQGKTPFYQNPDFWDRLALGFGGMTLNPNQALLSSVSERISSRAQERASTQQSNRTAEWLRSQGRPDLAEAVLSGSIDGKTAASIVYTQPKEQYNTITGEQLNAQRGTSFAPGDLFNVSPSGQITKVGGGGVSVSVGGEADADAEFFKKFYGGLGTELASVRTQAAQAAGNIPVLSALRELYSVAPTGPISGRLAEMFPEANDVSAAIEAARVQLAPQLRVEGSGSTSDIEYAGMLQSLGSMRNSPEANQALLDLMLLKAEVMQAKAEVAAQVRPNGLSPMDAAQKLDEIDRTMWKQSPRLQSINAIISKTGSAAPAGTGSTGGVQWRRVD